jgi:hypothetical protein
MSEIKKLADEAYRQRPRSTGPASRTALGLRVLGDDFLIAMKIARYSKQRRIRRRNTERYFLRRCSLRCSCCSLRPPVARADIFEWEYINLANPSEGMVAMFTQFRARVCHKLDHN